MPANVSAGSSCGRLYRGLDRSTDSTPGPEPAFHYSRRPTARAVKLPCPYERADFVVPKPDEGLRILPCHAVQKHDDAYSSGRDAWWMVSYAWFVETAASCDGMGT